MLRPGQPWLDTTGSPIDAHGGGLLLDGRKTFWYGSRRNGQMIATDLSKDHKPDDKTEARRIRAAGGMVERARPEQGYPARMWDPDGRSGLAVSRGQAAKALTRGDVAHAVSMLVESETRGVAASRPRSRAGSPRPQ